MASFPLWEATLLLLCYVPHQCGKKVSFNADFYCHGRETHTSSPEIQDGTDSTCLSVHGCESARYILRATLVNASYISLVRVVAEPLPNAVFYLPLGRDAFNVEPNTTAGNVQEYILQPDVKIHSLDFHDVRKVCELTIFDTEHDPAFVADNMWEEKQEGINYALIVVLPIAVVILVATTALVLWLIRRKKTGKMMRRKEPDGAKRRSTNVYLTENPRLNPVEVEVEYEEIRPPPKENSHEYMVLYWDGNSDEH